VSPGIGVLTIDTGLRIRSWNDWLSSATGLSEPAVLDRSVLDFVPRERAEATAELLREVMEKGSSRVLAPAFHRYLISCAPRVPSRHFEHMQQRVTIAALTDGQRVVGAMVTLEDVTERLEQERELAARIQAQDTPPTLIIAAAGADDWQLRGAAIRTLRQSATTAEVGHLLESLQRDHQNLNVLASALQVLIAASGEVLPALIDLLAHDHANLRMHAALALGELRDPAAVPGLIRALDDADTNVRFHAIEALGRLGAPQAVAPLARIAQSGDFFLSFPAVDALSRTDDATVVPALLTLLGQPLLRRAVIDALGALGDEGCVAPLARLLDEGGENVGAVAAALERIHARYETESGAGAHIVDLARQAITPEGAAHLAAAVTARAEPLRPLVVVLGWIGARGLEALLSVLGEAAIQASLAEAIAHIGPAAATQPLLARLGAEDRAVRQAAASLLGRLGDRRAVPALTLELSGADADFITTVASALAMLGDARALDALLPLFAHPHAAVRQATIAAVNSIGAEETHARIRARLSDPNPRVRECAVRVAGYFGYQDCTAGIFKALRDEADDVRRAAIEQLPVIEDPLAQDLLLEALRTETPRNRGAAAHAMRTAGGPAFEQALLGALADADPWVRYFAAGSLGEHRQASAATAAALGRTALTDRAPHVRIAAVRALGRVDADAAADVASRLVEDGDDDVASVAVEALGAGRDPGLDDVLEEAVRSPRTPIRVGAAQALGVRGTARAVHILAWSARVLEPRSLAHVAVHSLAQIAASPTAAGRADAVTALIDLGVDGTRRAEVLDAFATLPAEAAADVGEVLSSSPRPDARRVAVDVLARMRHLRASESLLAALEDEDPQVRLAAVDAFGRLGTMAAASRIDQMRRSDPDPAVQRRAEAVCARYGWGSSAPEDAR
jgi:HEAT repeat protein